MNMKRMHPLSIAMLLVLALPAYAQDVHDAHAAHEDHAQANEHDAHAGHAPQPTSDPHAGHSQHMQAPAAAEHTTHGAQEHAGHAMREQAASPYPTPTAEERAAAFPDLGGMDMREHMHGDPLITALRVEQLETDRDESLHWNVQAWIGRDLDKFKLRSEGERPHDSDTEGRVELLWSHATGPWWDRVVGLRHDLGPGPSRDWLALGVAGMAPYRVEVEATAYAGDGGRLAAVVEASHKLRLSQRWVLQSRLETSLYSKDDPANRIGGGLSEAGFGLRLGYEVTPRLVPYFGYAWSRRFGETARFAAADGEPRDAGEWILGVRFWL